MGGFKKTPFGSDRVSDRMSKLTNAMNLFEQTKKEIEDYVNHDSIHKIFSKTIKLTVFDTIFLNEKRYSKHKINLHIEANSEKQLRERVDSAKFQSQNDSIFFENYIKELKNENK